MKKLPQIKQCQKKKANQKEYEHLYTLIDSLYLKKNVLMI